MQRQNHVKKFAEEKGLIWVMCFWTEKKEKGPYSFEKKGTPKPLGIEGNTATY